MSYSRGDRISRAVAEFWAGRPRRLAANQAVVDQVARRRRTVQEQIWAKQYPPLNRPLDRLPVAAPPPSLPPGFTLHPPSSRSRDARGRQVDALLAKLGIRPRASRGG
jgi:hypothetical protein